MAGEKLQRIEAATLVIKGLEERGLLKKQQYRAATAADLERRYAL
jgi:hypothetical protein